MKKMKFCLLMLVILSLVLSGCASSGNMAPSSSEAASGVQGDYPQTAPAASGEEYYQTTEGAEDNAYPTTEGAEESYLAISENKEVLTGNESLITFSLKVDTAAYTNVGRYLKNGGLPPADAVRTEELINYFSYDADVSFSDEHPFAIYTEVGPSPFDSEKYMAMIRVKTEDIEKSELPSSNLIFLIDTSGSMDTHNKLPLLKSAFSLLVETLDEDDKVSIVTYAGSSEIVLDSVSGSNASAILNAINGLHPDGSTAGEGGIRTAYGLAEKNFMQGGNNRIILATDGDFNVGISDVDELAELIGEKRDSGVYLSILGFGAGNIRDDIMETLSTNGNGNYSYIDSVSTAEKVLVDELGSSLFTVANDVKAQVEFNTDNVESYRLIGYENRKLDNEDFSDDTKDAGEIGVGTDVVVMFELELSGEGGDNGELFEVRIRYKDPGKSESNLITKPVTRANIKKTTSSDFNFACSVAAFGGLLRDSGYTEDIRIDDVISLAKNNLGKDAKSYRLEYVLSLTQYKNIIG